MPHLDLTDDQAEAVRSTLRFARVKLASLLASQKTVDPAKREWAEERVAHIDAILALLPGVQS